MMRDKFANAHQTRDSKIRAAALTRRVLCVRLYENPSRHFGRGISITTVGVSLFSSPRLPFPLLKTGVVFNILDRKVVLEKTISLSCA